MHWLLSNSTIVWRREFAPLAAIVFGIVIILICMGGYWIEKKKWRHSRRLLVITLIVGIAAMIPTLIILNVSPPNSVNFGDDPKDFVIGGFGAVTFACICCAGGIGIRMKEERMKDDRDD